DWLLLVIASAFGLIALFPLFDVPVRIGVGLLSGLGVIIGPVLIGVSVWSYCRGHLGARFLLLAWAVLLAAVSVQAARNFGLVPTNVLTSNLLQVGSLLDMLLLSFALADRINAERRARESAQDRALLAQTELVEVLRDSEQRLEETVSERTAALESALTRERAIFERYVEFGALIAHEFRNPLAIIVNQAQLGRMSHLQDKDPTRRLEMIERAALRLQNLFEQWLQSDRLQDGEANLAVQPIDLSVWLPEMLAPDRLHIEQPIDCKADALIVSADEVLLGTALYNLIDNAAKYSPEAAVVQVRTVRDHGRVGIGVTDSGPGIPDAEQAKVFDKHYRASENTSSRGLGIGLYFTRQIMNAHGGEVTVVSHPSQGSTFTLWLPEGDTAAIQPSPDRR
ncbi:MAG: sensor histidine kinase, partial [Gammaproteobacteria bacterium]|nr:sensor histidine kinase [Gammaproteobacteria bacterium]